jgi:Leucine-rich repeat (LRR) protein
MNITTDDIYSLIVRHNSKKNQSKNNKIDENDLILTNGIIMNNSNISSIIYNSIEKNIVYNFKKLEFLSLRNNSLRNIDFIVKLPNLFYLDLFQNSIEDFSSLLIKNIFGYLRITIDAFNEKKNINT